MEDAPTCPCCFKQFTADVLNKSKTYQPSSSSNDDFFSLICQTCSPTSIEKALANNNKHPNPPIAWLLTPSEITSKSTEIVKATITNLDTIASIPLDRVTFQNTIHPLMFPPNYKTNPDIAACKFLQHCHPDENIRASASSAGSAFSQTRVEASMRQDVYQRVLSFSETEECECLDEYRGHFVKSLLRKYQRAGLSLNEEDRSMLKALLKEDSECCSMFSKNLSNDDTTLLFSKEELRGLPEPFIRERTQEEEEDGGRVVKLNLKYPDLIPVMSNCDVSSTRKRMMEAREGEGCNYAQNLELVQKGITIRKDIATLLGYDSWAEYICEIRMSGSSIAANTFLDEMWEKLNGAAKIELEGLVELKKKHSEDIGEVVEDKMQAWDTSFYNNLLLKTKYNVDNELIKEYFPLNHVVEQTLSIYQELLGLSFEELTPNTFWKWHPEVRCFSVKDKESEQNIGHFYLDLHPREGKYGHAAIFHLVKHANEHSAVDCMLCNLPKPSADNSTPSLLRHSNVVTFFHEFGHIMHGLCSEGDGNSTTLAKCPRDFVEAPSQMLENWVWQSEILNRLSCHYQTKEVLPKEKIDELIAAKHVNVAIGTCRQIYLSKLDLTIHGTNPPKNVHELQTLVDELRPKLSLVDNMAGCNMLRTFGHLMNQYSASYYGYMWAEVLSADMFATRFEVEGCMNPKTGMDYRKMVLAPGGTHDINDHLTRFLGRAPSQESFLKSRGILKE